MLRIVPHTVPRVGRSYEHFPDGFELHLLLCVPPDAYHTGARSMYPKPEARNLKLGTRNPQLDTRRGGYYLVTFPVRKAPMGRGLVALRTDRTTRVPSGVASPVPTNHAAKGCLLSTSKILATSRIGFRRKREFFIDNLLVRAHFIIQISSRPALRHGSLDSLFHVA